MIFGRERENNDCYISLLFDLMFEFYYVSRTVKPPLFEYTPSNWYGTAAVEEVLSHQSNGWEGQLVSISEPQLVPSDA